MLLVLIYTYSHTLHVDSFFCALYLFIYSFDLILAKAEKIIKHMSIGAFLFCISL